MSKSITKAQIAEDLTSILKEKKVKNFTDTIKLQLGTIPIRISVSLVSSASPIFPDPDSRSA